MKLGIFTDIHANLPALEKAIETFREHECTHIVHVGDLIGIGPYPRECMELANSVKEMSFIMGNHDFWYADGLPQPQPAWMSDEEVAHQKWTHAQIGKDYVSHVQKWPFTFDLQAPKQTRINFRHYGLNEEQNWFRGHIKFPKVDELDRLFDDVEADYIFYGHNHLANDQTGRCRYVNLGSAGCYRRPIVRLGIMSFADGEVHLEKLAITYDDRGLMEAFDEREVPARDFIRRTFITR